MTVLVDDRLYLIVVVAEGVRYEVGPRELDAAEEFVAAVKVDHPDWTVTMRREGDRG